MRVVRTILSITCLAMLSGAAWAEACTYREALMALEQGNALRGMALMRMASNDGDQRASQFLAENDHLIAQTPANANLQSANARLPSAINRF